MKEKDNVHNVNSFASLDSLDSSTDSSHSYRSSHPSSSHFVDSSISVKFFNAQCLHNKFTEFKDLIISEKLDIIAVCETWFDSNILNSEFSIANYKIFRLDRDINFYDPGTYSLNDRGGVLLLVRSSLNPVEFPEANTSAEILWCKFCPVPNRTIVFGVAYRPDKGKYTNINSICDSIHKACSYDDVVLVGDFNFRDINWSTYCSPHELDNIFIETLEENSLYQLIQEPTRGSNILDLLLTSNLDLVDSVLVDEKFSTSDHNSLFFTLKSPLPRINYKQRKVFLYSRGDYTSFNDEIKDMDWDLMLNGKSVDQQWEVIKNAYNALLEKYVPHKIIKEGSKLDPPWVRAKSVRRARQQRQKSWQKLRHRQLNCDKFSYEESKVTYKNSLNKSKAEYENRLVDSLKDNPKRFYNYTRNFTKTSSTVDVLEVDGNILDADVEKAEALNNFFSSVLTIEPPLHHTIPISTPKVDDTIHFKPFTVEQVAKKLSNLKLFKSSGPDGIHVNVLKKTVNFATPFCTLFNNSVRTGHTPEDWRLSNVTPIFKSGSRRYCKNYRPVALTSQVAKLLERLVQDQLLDHIVNNKIISCEQHGFQQKCSCVSQLLECLNDWTLSFDNNTPEDIIYLDFAKAFDTVPHHRLLYKLEHYGIRGKLLNWLQSFLTDRKQRVLLRNGNSSWQHITSGVPQGSILGPLLFLIFVNDLPSFANLTAKLFADDTKLYGPANTINDCEKLQHDLNKFAAWSKLWLLNFNAQKCVVVRLREAVRYSYSLNGVYLNHVPVQKDLGVYISNNLKPSDHITNIVRKAYQKIGLVKRCFTSLTAQKITTLYTTIIRPGLEYASPVWSPWYKSDINKLEKVQKKCLDLSLEPICLDSLECRRQYFDLVETYKYLNGMVKTPSDTFFKQPNRHLRGHSLKLAKDFSRTDVRKYFFSNRVIDHWNNLSQKTVQAPTLTSFKRAVRADRP